MTLEGNTKTPGKLDGFIGWFKRLIMKRATFLPVPGSDGRNFIALHQARTSKRLGPSPFIPNIIDESKFHPRCCWPKEKIAEARASLGVGDDKKLCIIPARLVEVKGLVPFVKALNSEWLSNWRIVIIGEGPLKQALLSTIGYKRLEGFVSIKDYVPYADMPLYYAAADLLLLPSIYDPNPLSVVEALFSALPVALTAMAGNVEEGVTEGKNGWVLPVMELEAYREKLKEVFATSIERLREMGGVSLAENSRFWHTQEAISKYLDVVTGDNNG